VTIASLEQCNAAYSVYGGITKIMICVIVSGGGKDAYQGESGRSLPIHEELAGIASCQVGCAEDSYPGDAHALQVYGISLMNNPKSTRATTFTDITCSTITS
jgi:hypothetical protein